MKILERNLQELGKSLFVSLPKSWADAYKLKKGSKIKLMQTEQGLLTIAPEFNIKEKSKETELVYDKYFQRRFFREYFSGNEKITIIFDKKINSNERNNLYTFLKRFMNVQILEDNESKIVLKSFKIEELTIEECLKRLYFLSSGMMSEVLEKANSLIIAESRDNMTKFYYMLVMQVRRFLEEGKFTKENQISLIRAMDFRMIAEKIQRIGEIMTNKNINKKENLKFFEELIPIYSKTFFCFLNKTYDKAPECWENLNILKEKYSSLLNKNADLSQILRYVKDISGLIK